MDYFPLNLTMFKSSITALKKEKLLPNNGK